ncbi:MAG: ribosome biogenesis GTP-binding protein YihA/YsxC [Hyphomicrobiaceae bacterium]
MANRPAERPKGARNRSQPAGGVDAPRAGPFTRPWTFVKSVPALEHLPPEGPPEIALAGRSNVGKSSLINALIRHKGMARTSNTPGRTQELNYFRVEWEPEFLLVDMPGYGFAKAPKEKVDEWTALVKDYLRGRRTLVRVLVLIDARHGIKPIDHDIMKLLDGAGVTFQVVLTKIDKISEAARPKALAAAREGVVQHPAAFPEVLATSSEKALGFDDLREAVTDVVLAHTR